MPVPVTVSAAPAPASRTRAAHWANDTATKFQNPWPSARGPPARSDVVKVRAVSARELAPHELAARNRTDADADASFCGMCVCTRALGWAGSEARALGCDRDRQSSVQNAGCSVS